jgi:hypothetical protein
LFEGVNVEGKAVLDLVVEFSGVATVRVLEHLLVLVKLLLVLLETSVVLLVSIAVVLHHLDPLLVGVLLLLTGFVNVTLEVASGLTAVL